MMGIVALVAIGAILLSLNAINALIPLIIIAILIVAAGGSMRGYSIFNLFGIATFFGIQMGAGRGTLKGKNVARQASLSPMRMKGFSTKVGGKLGITNKVTAARAGRQFARWSKNAEAAMRSGRAVPAMPKALARMIKSGSSGFSYGGRFGKEALTKFNADLKAGTVKLTDKNLQGMVFAKTQSHAVVRAFQRGTAFANIKAGVMTATTKAGKTVPLAVSKGAASAVGPAKHVGEQIAVGGILVGAAAAGGMAARSGRAAVSGPTSKNPTSERQQAIIGEPARAKLVELNGRLTTLESQRTAIRSALSTAYRTGDRSEAAKQVGKLAKVDAQIGDTKLGIRRVETEIRKTEARLEKERGFGGGKAMGGERPTVAKGLEEEARARDARLTQTNRQMEDLNTKTKAKMQDLTDQYNTGKINKSELDRQMKSLEKDFSRNFDRIYDYGEGKGSAMRFGTSMGGALAGAGQALAGGVTQLVGRTVEQFNAAKGMSISAAGENMTEAGKLKIGERATEMKEETERSSIAGLGRSFISQYAGAIALGSAAAAAAKYDQASADLAALSKIDTSKYTYTEQAEYTRQVLQKTQDVMDYYKKSTEQRAKADAHYDNVMIETGKYVSFPTAEKTVPAFNAGERTVPGMGEGQTIPAFNPGGVTVPAFNPRTNTPAFNPEPTVPQIGENGIQTPEGFNVHTGVGHGAGHAAGTSRLEEGKEAGASEVRSAQREAKEAGKGAEKGGGKEAEPENKNAEELERERKRQEALRKQQEEAERKAHGG